MKHSVSFDTTKFNMLVSQIQEPLSAISPTLEKNSSVMARNNLNLITTGIGHPLGHSVPLQSRMALPPGEQDISGTSHPHGHNTTLQCKVASDFKEIGGEGGDGEGQLETSQVQLALSLKEIEEINTRGLKRKREFPKKKEKEVVKKKRKKKDYDVVYIGETWRSGYERGCEHVRDFQNLEEDSHLLKHYLRAHKDIKMDDMKFGIRIKAPIRNV